MPAQLSVAVQGGASIPDGGTDTWPAALPLETSSRVYALSNPGDADLIGTASIAGAGFEITAGGGVFIPAGGTASLFVEADPMAVGTYTATVTIASDLPAYEFDIALRVAEFDQADIGWTSLGRRPHWTSQRTRPQWSSV